MNNSQLDACEAALFDLHRRCDAMEFSREELFAQKEKLDHEVRDASQRLKAFPKGLMGLVPDEIKRSAEYQETKRDYDQKFARLRNMNDLLRKLKIIR